MLVHGRPVGLTLAVVASASAAWALPGGWSTRFAFVAGWVAVLGVALVPRSGGGYLVGANAEGYVLLGLGLGLLLLGIVTVRPLRPTDP
ncbi:hypothetical protein [Nocardioides dongxiaopingii]|uniref:hypothetical protein n=1 Tax=Nocardioides dongxiaopingii TaxID=2576036 RepID=UPI0010C76F01|nr:hypothetical protein [Nocardioides dongxiaopingii]